MPSEVRSPPQILNCFRKKQQIRPLRRAAAPFDPMGFQVKFVSCKFGQHFSPLASATIPVESIRFLASTRMLIFSFLFSSMLEIAIAPSEPIALHEIFKVICVFEAALSV